MLSKGLGGIEQALVDYCEALKMEGHKVSAIISPASPIKASLLPLGVNILEVKNFSKWDIFAKKYIKKIMGQLAPDAVIVHGNRAASLVKKKGIRGKGEAKFLSPSLSFPFSLLSYPIIGVTHNYSIKPQIGLDAILATTNDLKNTVIKAGQPENTVFKLPNMVRIVNSLSFMVGSETKSNYKPQTTHDKRLRIGTMGRFVKKKGFDVFIRAIGHLKGQGLEFKAVIGGGGEEEASLKDLASNLNLGAEIEFIGWVKDKKQFFDSIDIFVLPSLHEPFGIILLEAFAYKKPVIVTDSEGPSEIASDGVDAIIVPKGDSAAMANAIMQLAKNPELAEKLAQNGYAKAAGYDIKHFAISLNDAVLKIVAGNGEL